MMDVYPVISGLIVFSIGVVVIFHVLRKQSNAPPMGGAFDYMIEQIEQLKRDNHRLRDSLSIVEDELQNLRHQIEELTAENKALRKMLRTEVK